MVYFLYDVPFQQRHDAFLIGFERLNFHLCQVVPFERFGVGKRLFQLRKVLFDCHCILVPEFLVDVDGFVQVDRLDGEYLESEQLGVGLGVDDGVAGQAL